MRILSRCLSLVAVVYLVSYLRLVETLPVDEEGYHGSGSIKSFRMQSPSPMFAPHQNSMKRKITRPSDLPSPANLLRPDTFQFYTFDKSGEVVTKQMTKYEIQSLIAAGGGILPPMAIEIEELHQAGDVPTGGTRVADVVQNVQNVLKGELNKPPAMISTIPKIPGHANTEWSSILPSILSGDMETIPLSPEPGQPQEDKIPVYLGHPEYSEITEKPMIQVPVITVEDKLPIQNNSTSVTADHGISDTESGANGPVFQILNTISVDRVKNNSYGSHLDDQLTDASESLDQSNVKPQIVNLTRNESEIAVSSTQKPIEGVKEDMISIVSETHSTSIKIPGLDEMKIENVSKLQTRRPVTTTEKIVAQNYVKPEKSNVETSRPVEIVDEFGKIQPIKPVLLNNVLKEPESYSSTTSEAEMSTLKSEIISTTMKDESVTMVAVSMGTEAVSITTEQDKVADIIGQQVVQEDSLKAALNNTKTIETTTVENASDKTTEKTQLDATTESKILDPIITTDFTSMTTTDAPEGTSSPIFMEGIKLEDPVTETVFKSTPEVTEKTNDVTIEEMPTTTFTSMSSETSTQKIDTEPERTELPIELEDSLSSMISQISDVIIEPSLSVMSDGPGIISDESLTTENVNQEIFTTIQSIMRESPATKEPFIIPESNTMDNITMESFLKMNATSDDKNSLQNARVKPSVSTQQNETPIVRIDIMSPAQTTEAPLKLNTSVEPDNYPEESPVVRIQLTEPISTVNHIIESLPPESYSVAPEIEPLTLPTEGDANANNISSSLIAGSSNNDKPIPDNITITDDAIIVDSAKKDPVNFGEKTPEVTTENWQTVTDNDKMMEIMLHQINFDELPIFQGHKRTPVTSSSISERENDTRIESSTEPEIPPIILNNDKSNTNKNLTTTLTETPPLSSLEPQMKDDNKGNVTEPEMNNSEEIPAAKIELETELTSAPSKIQLDDLPIIDYKFNKPEVNPKPSLSNKNITENHKKNESLTIYLKPPPLPSTSPNVYEDDPYKKLGETIEIISTTEIPQTTTNKTLKIKDQKKDSSMELMEKVPLIAMNQIPSHQDKKPFTTTTIASVTKKHEQVHPMGSEKWTLIPQKSPPALKLGMHTKRPAEESITPHPESTTTQQQPINQIPLTHSKTDDALDSSVKSLEPDIAYFSNLCNDLAFSFWTATNEGLSTTRSLAVSPFGMTSILAMVFLGARGRTSEKMNNLLRLDDVSSFNPHLIFQNVTDSVGLARKQGIANAAFVRELFADRVKVRKLLPFYKEQAQQFYDGVVAEVNFATISDLVRRRTNLMVRKQTGGRIKDFVRTNTLPLTSPLAALSANVFQTDCTSKDASSDGRDGELYFAVSPAIRQRKLVPIPATVWRAGILAGYEPNLDATAIALGGPNKLVSTIFVIPGQQGFTAPGDNLELLEERLIRGATHDGAWNKLLNVIIPRPGLELQVPKFSHRSVINATAALKRMGLQELFDKHADLKGINGVSADLHLTDVLQMNLFSTCGDENIQSGRHHVEIYPSSPQRNSRGPFKFPSAYKPRFTEPSSPSIQRENLDKPRLKLDRPFLYFVRHNPTGLILHMGRFNPRLLP